jgi:pyridoxal phosphate-dependent aminotransferase EpsN
LALINGTAAIHLGLKLLGVQRGDDVVVPTFTFVASCNPVLYECARPVFVDSERNSWNLDPDLLFQLLKRRAAANKLPRAVIVVHLFGQSADMLPIVEACQKYDVPVLEDAAEALGAFYNGLPVGSFGDVSALSFNGNKVITCSGGGMLLTKNSAMEQKARFWSAQACDPDELRNYLHSELGYNYRLSNVLAGIVLGQLEVLDERVANRRAVFDRYAAAFQELPGIVPQPEAVQDSGHALEQNKPSSHIDSARIRHTRWLSCFLIDEKRFGISASDLIRYLDAANVEARPLWKPMHTQPLFRGYECLGGAVAEDLNLRGLCLPSSSSLSADEQQFVIDCVREAHFRHSQKTSFSSKSGA